MNEKKDRNLVLTTICLRVLRTTSLTGRESRTLWYLTSTLSVAGEIVSNSNIGQELLIDKANVNRVIKRLCELGFLMRGPKAGVSYHYKLNPAYFKIIS